MLKKILLSSMLSLAFLGCAGENRSLWEKGNISGGDKPVLDYYFTKKENRELPYRTRLFYLRLVSDENKRYQVDKEKKEINEKKAEEECRKAFIEYKAKSQGLVDTPSCLFF